MAYITAAPQQSQKLLGNAADRSCFCCSYLTPSPNADAYRFFINGEPVTAGPGRGNVATADTAHSQLYDAVDVTAYVTAAARRNSNVVLALQGYRPTSAPAGQAGIHLILQYWFVDGTTFFATYTDTDNWRIFDATAMFNPTSSTASAYTQPLEYIDSRLNPVGWRLPDYTPTSAWVPPQAQPVFSPPPAAKTTQPLEIFWVEPASLKQVGNGLWIADFGSELMGGIVVNVTGVSGLLVGQWQCGN